MKYCSHCGKTLLDEAVVCPNCGCAVGNTVFRPNQQSGQVGYGASGKENLSTASLILGCCSCLAWLIPIIGFPITVAGMITGILGLTSSKRSFSIIGMVLSGIAFCITLMNSISGAALFSSLL